MSGRVSSMWRLVAVNGAAFSHEVSACVAYTYAPPLLLKAGFSQSAMTAIMGIGPLLALFSMRSLGRWSDHCSSRYGRRRPFIVSLSLLLMLSLIIIPVASCQPSASLFSSSLLALGVVVMDYATIVVFNSCEALVYDLLQSQHNGNSMSCQQSTKRFSLYSATLSLGSCVGYLITAVDWSHFGISFGDQEQTAFAITALLLATGVCLTVVLADEKPLLGERVQQDISVQVLARLVDKEDPRVMWLAPVPFRIGHLLRIIAIYIIHVPAKFCVLVCKWLSGCRQVPVLPRNLFLSTFMAWLAINCQGLFFTDYVGQAVYRGHPNARSPSPSASLYDQGVRSGCYGLFLHGVLACMYSAFIQDRVTGLIGLRATYVSGMAVYTLSMVAILFTSVPTMVHFWSLLSGTGFAVVTTIPASLLALYNGNGMFCEENFKSKPNDLQEEDERLSERGGDRDCFASDVAVLECAFCLSRIILAVCMGPMVDWTRLVECYIIGATVFGAASCLLSWRVIYSVG